MASIVPVQPTTSPVPLTWADLYRFTVDEYERSVLDNPRVELINGYVVTKMGKKPPHVWTVDCAEQWLRANIPVAWCVRRESPVRIPDFDEPEPDVTIARGSRATYRNRHPGPGDVALIIEAAETTYDRDRGDKWLAYAKAGIPVYWIINLVQHQIEVYTDPQPAGYQSRVDFTPGQTISVIIDGQQIGQVAVDDILP
jgi:Uma2 family endonuclease